MVECFEACWVKVFDAGVCPCQKVTHLLVVCNLLNCFSYPSSVAGEMRGAMQAFQVIAVGQQESWESIIFDFFYSDE